VSKTWNEMNEVNDAVTEKERRSNKSSLRDRLRTRILRTDPRSVTEDVNRTPIAVAKDGDDTPMKTLVQDPRSPGMTGVDRTPIVVLAGKEDTKTPLRGAIPPHFELPPTTPQDFTPIDPADPRSPTTTMNPRTPLITSTPATIPLSVKDQSQPSCILADRLRGEALAAILGHQQQVSTVTAPSAEGNVADHNDSSLLI